MERILPVVLMSLAADDHVVLAAELALDVCESVLHPALVFGLGEVDEGLVDEGS